MPISALAEIVADLNRDLTSKSRYERVLDALARSFPCDAAALLQLEGDYLVPRALRGLSSDTWGRRFRVGDNPRLERILTALGPVRFPSDSELPDPYDGLIDSSSPQLYVHDCMGASLCVDGKIWGVLTIDALQPGSFATVDLELLSAFVNVAAASIRAAELIAALATDIERQRVFNRSLDSQPGPTEFVGQSEPVNRLRRDLEAIAPTDLGVLILGETGVGKELVARLIHEASSNAEQPMVHVNCAALPESLAEAELFGHVKGAFSGADKDRIGKFELADQGTLFLDEIGELPLSIQPKLLRALQTGDIQRIGSDERLLANVRVIAATNRDLESEILAGRFRADLFHRINIYPISVPALRDRPTDIPLLAGYFLQGCERKLGSHGLRLSAGAARKLQDYQWPGNVRELENTIYRGAVKATARSDARQKVITLNASDFTGIAAPELSVESITALHSPPLAQSTLTEAVDEFKRTVIQERVEQYGLNIAKAARSLGLDRSNLHRQMTRLGLR